MNRWAAAACLAIGAAGSSSSPAWSQSSAPKAEAVAEAPGTVVPPAFLECVNEYRRTFRDEPDRSFGCTRAYLDSLPGSDGSTVDMAEASRRAADVGDFYIDNHLGAEIVLGLAPEEGSEARSSSLTREFLLRSYVRSARASGETLCDLYYDFFSEGTIRSVMAGSCAVANRDRLIGELLSLADTIGGE
jgi:hypothetical protein